MSTQIRPMVPQSSNSGQIQAAREPHKAPFYIPTTRQLEPGAKNPLILALRSTIPEEVDWALPRLIIASYDHLDKFILERYIDALPALLYWPNKWLDDLESCAALEEAKKSGNAGIALAAVPEWMVDSSTETRAINSLLVLRNASFSGSNSRHMASKGFINYITRLFSLPFDYLLDVLLRSPEPIQHSLVIFQSIMPYLSPTQPILRILSTTLPNLLLETRDMAILHLLLPLIISALLIPTLPPLPATIAPHLMLLLSLSPPPSILDLTLDLLISLTLSPGPARIVLSSPNISAHLRHLMRLLEHGARQTSASFDPYQSMMGGMARNPASTAWAAEEASKRRTIEREEAQRTIEMYGNGSIMEEVGDRQPVIADSIKAKLYKMKEPQRSISWMHESFIYSSASQLLQVTFWHAYRDFFTTASASEPLLSASEVIKNVTIAFPGAAAKVWADETGARRFVIAGMGFRRATDDVGKYVCKWANCQQTTGNTNSAQLLSHVQSAHLFQPTACFWGTCTSNSCTTSHLLTHLPLSRQQSIPEMVLSNPDSESWLSAPNITQRAAPRLPSTYKLHFTAYSTPSDPRTRHPMGVAFLSSLLIRNLAKTLKSEILAAPENMMNTDEIDGMTRQEKKEKEERYGLPIPESVLKEEQEEEREMMNDQLNKDSKLEGKLDWEERERARSAFEVLEERLGEVLAGNLSGLGQYLGDAWGW